jgi:hypothetical protein
MKRRVSRGLSTGLIALSLFVAALAFQAMAQGGYESTTTLLAPEPEASAEFGRSVAIDGGIVVVGEPQADVGGVLAGAAYVYDSGGTLVTSLKSPELQSNARFGRSVAVDSGIIVVGEPNLTFDEIWMAGKAHVLDSEGSLIATLEAPEPLATAHFGYCVAVSGDTVVVGEHWALVEEKSEAGRAHIFDTDGSHRATIRAPEPTVGGNFGLSLAVSGGTVVVGEVAHTLDKAVLGPGSVYVFDSEGNLKTTLKSPEPERSKNFGYSVDISGDTILVGESYAEADGKEKAGKAYLFDEEGNLLKTLQAPEPEAGAEFGYSVGISGDTLIVGEYKADVEALNEGRAHVFDSEGNHLTTLLAPEAGVAAGFGSSVAAWEGLVVVGEPTAKVGSETKAGRAYIFGGEGAQAEPQPKTKAEAPEVKTEPESESSGRGIPGFPYESVVLGLMMGAAVLWLLTRQSAGGA